jgi:hypothetical protein
MRWSPELAYVVGLIATDGCLSPDGRHIDFTSKDLELVEAFKRCLGLQNRIGVKSSGSSQRRYYRVQFANVRFYRWLVELGLTPRKSKTLGPLQIPDEFFVDFLRGCLDGDGNIRVYSDPKFPTSQRLYVRFISASFAYTCWLQQNIQRLIGVRGYIQPTRKSYELTYAKQASKILLARLYYQPGIPCLQRKRVLAEEFLSRGGGTADALASGASGHKRP